MSRAETSFLAAVLAVLSIPAAAQVRTDRDGDFAAAVSAARAAVPAPRALAKPAALVAAQTGPKVPASCADAKELETSYDVRLIDASGHKIDLRFEYAGCDEEPRNDYLPPYTERSYKAADGYGLTITTNEGEEGSDVLLSRGTAWIGRFGYQKNAKVVSGEEIATNDVVIAQGRDQVKYGAILRATYGVFAQTKICDEGIKKLAGSSPRGSDGKVSTGFSRGGPSLVLLNNAKAYYYHEDCDICAELDVCDLTTGATGAVITAHSVSCSDMNPYRQERGEIYSACEGNPR